MSTQIPRRDGFYYGQVGGEASEKTIVRLEQNLVVTAFGRAYDLHMVHGTLIGEAIPSEEECAAIHALKAWRDNLVAQAKEDPAGAVAKCLAVLPPPKE